VLCGVCRPVMDVRDVRGMLHGVGGEAGRTRNGAQIAAESDNKRTILVTG